MRRTALAGACAALAFAAGCGDDTDGGSGGESAGEAAAPTELAITATEEGKAGKLEVPSEVKGGLVKITLTNQGKNPHDAQIVRVVGDHDAADVLKAIDTEEGAGTPEWIEDGGGVGAAKPGGTRTATQVLAPGKYVAFDTENEGGEPATAEFTVTEGEGGELPEAEATVTAKDFTFETSGLKAGSNTVRFENTGKELHHALFFPMAEGATLDAVKKFFETEGEAEGKPPVDFEAGVGTAVIDGGIEQVIDLELEAGKYAAVCFINNRAGGPPHAVMGMLTEVEVQ